MADIIELKGTDRLIDSVDILNENFRTLKEAGGISVGAIIPFAGNGDIPVGFLLCNGASVGIETYPALFDVIGYTYGGSGDYFNLPNLTDKFIEGASSAGTDKEAGLPNITGTVRCYSEYNLNNSNYWDDGSALNGAFYWNSALESSEAYGTSTNMTSGTNDAIRNVRFDASKSNSTYGNSATVQPPALTMRYIIKAFAGASADSTDVAITNVANDVTLLSSQMVNKNGDTLGGNLFTHAYDDGVGASSCKMIVCKSDTIKGTIPTNTQWHTLVMAKDSSDSIGNEAKYGQVETTVETSGGIHTAIETFKNQAGSTARATIAVGYKADGTVYTQAPTPANTDVSTQIATTAFVNGSNVVAKGSNYIRYGNGMQICWGTFTNNSASGTLITYPVAFTAAPAITNGIAHSGDGKGLSYRYIVGPSTKTSFRVYVFNGNNAVTADGIGLAYTAVGSWK